MIIMGSNTSKRIIELDILRGVSCLIVILYHYTTRYEELFRHKDQYVFNMSFGYMGVSVFFILSGFLVMMNIKPKRNALNFGYKRVIRLYPVYWVALIITFITTSFFLPERTVSLKYALINLSMLQEFIGVPSVDGAYWTLRYEIWFYLIVAVILLFKQIKNIIPICVAWILAAIALTTIKTIVHNKIVSVISVMLITQYAHMFIVGIALHELYEKRSIRISYILIGLSIVNQFINFKISYGIFYIVLITLFYLIVSSKDITRPRWLIYISRPIVYISSISYPLYLIHQNVGYAIIKFLENYIGSEWLILIPITISILIATMLHKYIEVPSAKFLEKHIHYDKGICKIRND